MKGQLSAEMLIVLAIILGLIFIVFAQMAKSTKDVSSAVDERTGMLIEGAKFKPMDASCSKDVDCERFNRTWSCDTVKGYCRE